MKIIKKLKEVAVCEICNQELVAYESPYRVDYNEEKHFHLQYRVNYNEEKYYFHLKCVDKLLIEKAKYGKNN